MIDLPLRTADLVASLWRSAAADGGGGAAAAVPELAPSTRLVHDPDLAFLHAHGDAPPPETATHVVALLTTLAERRDDLVAEVRLLREAMVAVCRRLEERDDALHRILEARVDRLAAEQ